MGIETIGRGSRALLGLLDMTSAGIGPDHLNNDVQAVLEANYLLGEGCFRVASVQANCAVAGQDWSVTLTVPNGRVWVVRECGVYFQVDPASLAFVNGGRIGLAVANFSPPLDPAGTGGFEADPIMFIHDFFETRQTTTITGAPVNVSRIGGNHVFNPPLVCGGGISFIAATSELSNSTAVGTELHVWASIYDLPA